MALSAVISTCYTTVDGKILSVSAYVIHSKFVAIARQKNNISAV